ncbi:hypothetical protein SUGI_0036920 [Cryptomeria japonica]|nr:hypothetical protein SUGI_0036920 [Cryptomeria japonica]
MKNPNKRYKLGTTHSSASSMQEVDPFMSKNATSISENGLQREVRLTQSVQDRRSVNEFLESIQQKSQERSSSQGMEIPPDNQSKDQEVVPIEEILGNPDMRFLDEYFKSRDMISPL